jgi:hypothetical protein
MGADEMLLPIHDKGFFKRGQEHIFIGPLIERKNQEPMVFSRIAVCQGAGGVTPKTIGFKPFFSNAPRIRPNAIRYEID